MLPRTVEVVMSIIWPGLMADPVVVVDVRRIGVAGLVGEVGMLLRWRRRSMEGFGAARRRGSVGRSSSVFLGRYRHGKNDQRCNDK
jgi:hypothetical protein